MFMTGVLCTICGAQVYFGLSGSCVSEKKVFLCCLRSIWHLSVCPSICPVVTLSWYSYVSQATHAFLRMLPLCLLAKFCFL